MIFRIYNSYLGFTIVSKICFNRGIIDVDFKI